VPRKKTVTVHVQAKLVWEVHIHPQTRQYMGICRMLNLNAVGDSWGDFQQAANEAMQLLLEDLFEEGDLQRFLHRNGWRLATPLPNRGDARPCFDVPYETDFKRDPEELLVS
jgi:predicted RNase H-like HicB family nuclease